MHGVMSYPPCTARQKWMCFRMDSDRQFNAKGSGCDADFTTSVSMTLSKKKILSHTLPDVPDWSDIYLNQLMM